LKTGNSKTTSCNLDKSTPLGWEEMNLEDPRGSHISNFQPETRPILLLMRQLALYSREDLLEWAMLTKNLIENNSTVHNMTSESH